jgi:uncharacterized membrane protein YtjA (UPF0391 family)
MLHWTLVFFVLAIIAAFFGFGNISATLSGIAKILFMVFLVMFVVMLVMNIVSGRSPRI